VHYTKFRKSRNIYENNDNYVGFIFNTMIKYIMEITNLIMNYTMILLTFIDSVSLLISETHDFIRIFRK